MADVLPSGSRGAAGRLLPTATGPAAALHAGWKVVQTQMEWASGIATVTRCIVDGTQAVNPHVVVRVYAQICSLHPAIGPERRFNGGADVHRLGLCDTILVFP